MKVKSLKSTIMRRVWRHFMWSILTNRGLVPGLAFGISIQLFRQQVFVAQVMDSFLATEVRQLPGFVLHLITNTDNIASLLTVAIMVSSVWLLYRYVVTSGIMNQTQSWMNSRLTTN